MLAILCIAIKYLQRTCLPCESMEIRVDKSVGAHTTPVVFAFTRVPDQTNNGCDEKCWRKFSTENNVVLCLEINTQELSYKLKFHA